VPELPAPGEGFQFADQFKNLGADKKNFPAHAECKKINLSKVSIKNDCIKG
jgi:hypothetical protein